MIPVMEDYIHTRIPSNRRATIFSIKNMMTSLLFAIISPFLGHMVDLWSVQTAFLLMGVILIVITIIFAIVFRNIKKK